MAEVAPLRHGVVGAEALGASSLRQVRGAEDPVDDGEPEVLVACLVVDGVVPVVPLGCRDDPPDDGKAQPHVGVLEDREERDEHSRAGEHARVVAEDEQRDDRERLGERGVERMEAAGRHPVHLLDAVVHAVEPPEQRHRVGQTVTPVIPDEHERDRERDREHARHRALDVEATYPDQR